MKSSWPRANRIYIVPTAHGLVFLVLVLVMIITASSAGNNLVYIVGFSLFAVYMLAMLHTHYNLKAIKAELQSVDDAFVGEPVRVLLNVVNLSGRERYLLEARSADKRLAAKLSTLSIVPEDGRATLEIWLKADARGEFTIPRLTVSTVYPMGLFRAWTYLELPGSYFVYPRRVGDLSLSRSRPGAGDGRRWGDQASQQNEDFQEHRRFQPGQSLRHVDWKAYARTGELLAKSYQDSTPEFYSLRWADLAGKPTETALSQLSAWIDDLQKRGVSFELVLPGRTMGRNSGREHAQRCLRELARFSGAAA